MADANSQRHDREHHCYGPKHPDGSRAIFWKLPGGRGAGGMADADNQRPQGHRRSIRLHDQGGRQVQDGRPAESGFWDGNWIGCADGKARILEPGLEPLAHGIPARVVRLRAYGNAIVPQVAAEFVRAYMMEASP